MGFTPAGSGYAPPDGVVTPRQERQLQVFGPILLNPSDEIDEVTRRGAASELVMMGLPDATATLDEALRSEHASVVLATVSALEQAPDPLPDLIEALVAALRHPPDGTEDRLAMLIPRFGSDGLERITALALDTDLPAAERTGSVRALATYRSPEAAGRLVALLDPARAEPPEMVEATCRALGQLTGFPYGADPAAWRDWWADVQNLPREQWLSRFVESLSGQLTKLQQEIDRKTRATDRLERRIVETYRDLFPAQPVGQQIAGLPDLLSDELDVVRRFAVGRVDRLLRDGVRVPQGLQDQLAGRLE
ncbi:MAG: HEAT repeat domain-containing protein, partial [Planctomycetota bacterium]